MSRASRRLREPFEGITPPGTNKLTAVLGNLVMWFGLLGVVLFVGWGITVIFGGLTS